MAREASQVREQAVLRRLAKAGREITQRATEGDGEWAGEHPGSGVGGGVGLGVPWWLFLPNPTR